MNFAPRCLTCGELPLAAYHNPTVIAPRQRPFDLKGVTGEPVANSSFPAPHERGRSKFMTEVVMGVNLKLVGTRGLYKAGFRAK